MWFKFKTALVTLKEAMETHFDKLASSILAGLPEVEETNEEDKMDYNFVGKNMTNKQWVCKKCKSVNDGVDPYARVCCQTCWTERSKKDIPAK